MPKILLVEDDDSVRKMLRMTLVKMGHSVVEARNGNEAVEAFNAAAPDLVLTDLIMPDKEGLETIRDLRKLQPNLKMIAMSGGGRGSAVDYLKIAKQMGAARTLNKPFSQETLSAMIAEVLAEG